MNFILSDSFYKSSVNNFFREMSIKDKDYFLDQNINFIGSTISFPFCYWNGSFNFNINNAPVLLYDNFLNISKSTGLPLYLDFSNLLLDEKDFYDRMGEVILSIFQNGSNNIILSNLDFYKYIKSKYPYYKYILSEKFFITHQENYLNELNSIINNKDFVGIQIPYIFYTSEFFNNFKFKQKFILKINNICNQDCKKYFECQMEENSFQYHFSELNCIESCPFISNGLSDTNNNLISLNQCKEYTKLGINKFFIDSSPRNSKNNYLAFLINYFCNPDKYYNIYSDWGKNNG